VVLYTSSGAWLGTRRVNLIHNASSPWRCRDLFFHRTLCLFHDVDVLSATSLDELVLADEGFNPIARESWAKFHPRLLHEMRTAHAEIQTTPEPNTSGDLRGRDPQETQKLKIEAHEHFDEDPGGPDRIQARCRREGRMSIEARSLTGCVGRMTTCRQRWIWQSPEMIAIVCSRIV
jgi:hypothetical protein